MDDFFDSFRHSVTDLEDSSPYSKSSVSSRISLLVSPTLLVNKQSKCRLPQLLLLRELGSSAMSAKPA